MILSAPPRGNTVENDGGAPPRVVTARDLAAAGEAMGGRVTTTFEMAATSRERRKARGNIARFGSGDRGEGQSEQ